MVRCGCYYTVDEINFSNPFRSNSFRSNSHIRENFGPDFSYLTVTNDIYLYLIFDE